MSCYHQLVESLHSASSMSFALSMLMRGRALDSSCAEIINQCSEFTANLMCHLTQDSELPIRRSCSRAATLSRGLVCNSTCSWAPERSRSNQLSPPMAGPSAAHKSVLGLGPEESETKTPKARTLTFVAKRVGKTNPWLPGQVASGHHCLQCGDCCCSA